MPKPRKSRFSDSRRQSSLISDTTHLADGLKAARLSRQLSQAELAAKLGLRQRQISDLERASNDPRLSTIHNVARAIELELMLIPRHLISAVNALQRPGTDASKRPLYALGDDDAQIDANEPLRPQAGDSRESRRQPAQRARVRRKRSR
jgi:transcriptional regulator with XRE-family HTH domain